MTTSTRQARSQRDTASFELLLGPAFMLIITVGAYFLYQHGKLDRERETETWLQEVLQHQDPWKRYNQLNSGFFEHDPTDDQRHRIGEQQTRALEQALVARNEAAFDLVEKQGISNELLDRYPRNPARRQQQLEALAAVWPDIACRSHVVRMSLVRMADRCHLHEAAPPVARQTVIDCVRSGAQSLGTQADLTRWMDSAVLGEPLTGTSE